MIDGQHEISAGGVSHWVRVAGASRPGTPVVLVHGGPGASACPYEAIGDRLARRVPVVFYDQRGCGRSGKPAQADTYTFARLVRDLDELRVALGLESFVLWGVSFGAVLAAEYVVTYPRRVSRLILQAPPIVGPLHPGAIALQPAAIDALATPVTRAALRARLDGVEDPVQRVWLAHAVLAEDVVTRRRLALRNPDGGADSDGKDEPDFGFNETMARALLATMRTDLIDDLADLDTATLVMAGLWDGNVGVDSARDLVVRLRNASLHLFHRSAHSPHDEEPDEYLAAIEAFLVNG
ncbi:alpha/beta fold hydrolase [Couchioplanes azureus]|uniref:alpha/beta fold hydrolase n=1 Tax=Couchioplanes caeruleus TaxID=56438 RepID=UPI00166F65E1|nr:alpha/beta hydrolase [Couchioplanes caeruleus]GGQ82671.1 proline iminopeptidase [Couchioplanes caeruleus subsp. azureus]